MPIILEFSEQENNSSLSILFKKSEQYIIQCPSTHTIANNHFFNAIMSHLSSNAGAAWFPFAKIDMIDGSFDLADEFSTLLMLYLYIISGNETLILQNPVKSISLKWKISKEELAVFLGKNLENSATTRNVFEKIKDHPLLKEAFFEILSSYFQFKNPLKQSYNQLKTHFTQEANRLIREYEQFSTSLHQEKKAGLQVIISRIHSPNKNDFKTAIEEAIVNSPNLFSGTRSRVYQLCMECLAREYMVSTLLEKTQHLEKPIQTWKSSNQYSPNVYQKYLHKKAISSEMRVILDKINLFYQSFFYDANPTVSESYTLSQNFLSKIDPSQTNAPPLLASMATTAAAVATQTKDRLISLASSIFFPTP